ncbi:MAG: polysaccharide biosynthesis/export family protein [Chthoniobacteraceae bacterium]|jgi:polysaccharide biosynthesis/export protein
MKPIPNDTVRPERKLIGCAAGLAWLGAILIVFCTAACQTPDGPGTAALDPSAPEELTLNAGDVLQVTFIGSPEMSQSQKISPDGKINLPIIGEVPVAGRTLANLQGQLSELYRTQLQNTQVVVSLASGGIPVIVSGAVKQPGQELFERPTTVFQVIMQAGGITQYGDLKKVHLVRTEGSSEQTYILDLSQTINGRTTSPIYVRGGDVVYVPERFFTF